MNCPQHSGSSATAYCQDCARPLCELCARRVGSGVYCEPCLAARLGASIGGQPTPGQPGAAEPDAKPVLAAFLGLIPGVGAMYNGQFVKALAHVFIFAILVHFAGDSDVFGLLVSAWVFYQVFDAYQTARARREGLPLPNPFGLNDLGERLGLGRPPSAVTGRAASFASAAGDADPTRAGAYPAPPRAADAGAEAGAPPAAEALLMPYSEPPTAGMPAFRQPGREPVGAILLIVVGLMLLGETLGILHWRWIGRSWPLVILGVGVWLLVSRLREGPDGEPK